MQTVNFACAHCGKLMGVGVNFLGQQVRCPHCKQVVQAPAAAVGSPVAADRTFLTPPPREDESIFAPPDITDALFNEASRPPKVEIPVEPGPAWPDPLREGDDAALVVPDGPTLMEPLPSEVDERTSAYVPERTSLLHPPEAAGPAAEVPWEQPGADAQEVDLAAAAGDSSASRVILRQGRGGTGAMIALIFLIPYAVLATAAAVYFYYRASKVHHPLEMLQDNIGDNPGATKRNSSVVYKRIPADFDLPPRLHVPLGGTLRVGDLEVTPEKVERQRVVYSYEGSAREPTPSTADALVLTLRLKNVSEDVSFVPTDPAFVRKWRVGQNGETDKPYTFLEIGRRRFYGGPCAWSPRGPRPPGRRDADPREYVQGQDSKLLKPGEETQAIVCTDPEDPEVLSAVSAHGGRLVWRVQLRRGLVRLHNDKEVSATAVVGVDIDPKDVTR